MVESATFNLVKRKEVTEDYVPRAEDYRYEIKRRAHCFMNMDDQVSYYVQDLKMKNPLENMRGVVSLPQPNQWKLQALKSWLVERPLKPDTRDLEFLRNAIQKCMDALSEAVTKDPSLTQGPLGKRSSSAILTGGDLLGTSTLETGASRASIMEVIAKQDAILGAVSRQAKQQTILNKITILTQSNMGYQQEVASLRSTLNDIENRIMTVELKIDETPSSEAKLKKIISQQEERKAEVKGQIQELEAQIANTKATIDTHQEELAVLEKESEALPSPSAKRTKMEMEPESVEV
jgi:septal ring factor EnvC (AmiA/AmiB activator)